MKTQKKEPNGPYDSKNAPDYNSIWWEHGHWKAEGMFHKQVISSYLKPNTKWLDVGCGTGYFLQNFPETDRVGLDLSAAMINEAKQANPNVPFLQQSIVDDNPELEGRFDLVTCTGQPWAYLPSLTLQEKVVENLAKWTAPNGTCVLSQIDISDIVKIDNLSYFSDEASIRPGSTFLLGAYWLHKDINGIDHYCLSPNIDQWIRWFSVYFRRIEIVYGPHEPNYIPIPRRLIICSEKRGINDTEPVVVIGQPIPEQVTSPFEMAAKLSHRQLMGELMRRVKSGELMNALTRKIFK